MLLRDTALVCGPSKKNLLFKPTVVYLILIMDRIRKHPYIFLGSLALFLMLFGNWAISLSDPDETFYALTALEMLKGVNYLTPHLFGQPQFEKPPLYYWLLMLFFSVFGESAFVARMPAALFGAAGVVGTFYFVKRVVSERAAFICALIAATCLWSVGLSKAVLIDMIFGVLCAFASFSFYLWYEQRKDAELFRFALCAALATLAKGPLGLAFPLIASVLYLALHREWSILIRFILGRWWLVFGAIAIPWYAYTFAMYSGDFWEEFFVRDHWLRLLLAEHKNFDKWFFYPLCMILALFPWCVFLGYFGRGWKQRKNLYGYLALTILVVFGVCEVAHSKLATYIAPLYGPLFVLFGCSIDACIDRPGVWIRRAAAVLCMILGLAAGASPIFLLHRLPDLLPQICLTVAPLCLGFLFAGWSLLYGRFERAMASLVVMIFAFVCLGGSMLPGYFERGFTDSDLPQLIRERGYGKLPIVSSKLYARGVNYHSGNPVVVFSDKAQPFWSPHPVQVIYEDRDVREFYSKQGTVLSILGNRDVIRLKALLGSEYMVREIYSYFGRTILLSQKIGGAAPWGGAARLSTVNPEIIKPSGDT